MTLSTLATPADEGLGLDGDTALALLERSIAYGHARVAVIRLAVAVRCGAQVPVAHRDYCVRVAARDPSLRRLLDSIEPSFAQAFNGHRDAS